MSARVFSPLLPWHAFYSQRIMIVLVRKVLPPAAAVARQRDVAGYGLGGLQAEHPTRGVENASAVRALIRHARCHSFEKTSSAMCHAVPHIHLLLTIGNQK